MFYQGFMSNLVGVRDETSLGSWNSWGVHQHQGCHGKEAQGLPEQYSRTARLPAGPQTPFSAEALEFRGATAQQVSLPIPSERLVPYFLFHTGGLLSIIMKKIHLVQK